MPFNILPRPAETTSQRTDSVQRVLQMTQNETDQVKQNALEAIVRPPGATATDFIWGVLVTGLVALLVLSILGLTHVMGHAVNDDRLITVFSTSLAGLLGLFIKSPAG